MDTKSETALSPLSCPRCGCAESRVIQTRRMNRAADPQPLPSLKRTRECAHCAKQYRTTETLEEIDLASQVWRCRIGRVVIDPRTDLTYGEYSGEWTSHVVTVQIDSIEYELDTRNPMLAERYPCLVEVTAQGIVVRSGGAE